jgi:hypothetical protein
MDISRPPYACPSTHATATVAMLDRHPRRIGVTNGDVDAPHRIARGEQARANHQCAHHRATSITGRGSAPSRTSSTRVGAHTVAVQQALTSPVSTEG